jgi:LRR receptor-like serine/threonine-protein kinase EFR
MITGTIPTTIGFFYQLQRLWIRFTSITGTIPTEIGMCTNLHALMITSSKINGTIPNEIINIPLLGM